MATEPRSFDFEQLLSRTPIFVELMAIYLRSSPGIQEAIGELVHLANDSSLAASERERAQAAIAGALLAFADPEARAERVREAQRPGSRGGKSLPVRQQVVFGQRLKEKRTASKLTQEELARRAGVRQSAISMMERGSVAPREQPWPSWPPSSA